LDHINGHRDDGNLPLIADLVEQGQRREKAMIHHHPLGSDQIEPRFNHLCREMLC
jgi:hypothetical protein